MAATRRGVAVSTVLLIILAVGVFFLVRLAMGATANGDVPPIVASPDATPRTGDSSTTIPDNTGTDGKPGNPAQDGSNPGPRDGSNPGPRENTQTTNPEPQPPRPAVPLSPIVGVGPQVTFQYERAFGFVVEFYVEQAFSVQVRVADINIIQPGNELVIENPTGEDVRKCYRGTIQPGETGPLCTTYVRESESAEQAGVYHQGELELVVRATCTSKAGRPCENLPDHYTPSSENPIDVTWNYYYEW